VRRAELAANLAEVEQRIVAACQIAGRRREEVTLIAVTKTWPAADAALLRDLGVHDLAENRDQEARVKAAEVTGVRWHFVGQLQTNKARSVATYADVVHSVDRLDLVDALSVAAVRANRTLGVLLQISLDGQRGGALPDDVPWLAERVEQLPGLALQGVMAVAPLGAAPLAAFARLRQISANLTVLHPAATVISAGMSGDLEPAILSGATHVRVGTAVLGHREGPLR
jgi:pyridoxal phosphate enzyme (YggS family)